MPQQISDLSYERLPIDVTVVLDVSASVTGSVLDQLRQSVRQLKADLGPRDRLKLVAFNMQVRRLADFEAPAAATDTAFASLSGRGSSAIFDSVAVPLASPAPEGRRHLIVLFTDGQDSSSISDPDALFDVARRTTANGRYRAGVDRAGAQQRVAVCALARTAADHDWPDVRSARQGNRRHGGADDRRREPRLNVPAHAGGLPRELCAVFHAARASLAAGSHTIDVRVKQDGTDVRARRGYVWK